MKYSWYFSLCNSKQRLKQRRIAPFSVLVFIFFHSTSKLQSHRFKLRQQAPFIHLGFNIISAVSTSKHRFKLYQNVPLSVLTINIFSAVPTCKSSFQIASESTAWCPWFHFFPAVSTSKIVSTCVRRYRF